MKIDGIEFENWSHGDRWRALKKRADAGEINDLKYRRTRVALSMENVITKAKTVIQYYVPDFSYTEAGIQIFETVLYEGRGRTRVEYKLVRRMVMAQYGIEIRETIATR